MFQIDNTSATGSLPTPAVAGTPGYFTGGNPLGGVPATTVTADFLNGVQAELMTLLTKAAVIADKTLFTQVLRALSRLGSWNINTLSSTQTLTLDQQGLVFVNAGSGNVTLTLPAAAAMASTLSPSPYVSYRFVRTDSSGNTVTIVAGSGDSIVDTAGATLAVAGRMALHSDGATKWYQTSTATPTLTGVALLASANAFTSTNSYAAASTFTAAVTMTKAVSLTQVGLTFANPLTVAMNTGTNFSVTVTSNFTLAAPTSTTTGQQGSIMITQDGTGSRIITFNSIWKFPGGILPTLSTAANAVDILNYLVLPNGNIAAQLQKGFA